MKLCFLKWYLRLRITLEELDFWGGEQGGQGNSNWKFRYVWFWCMWRDLNDGTYASVQDMLVIHDEVIDKYLQDSKSCPWNPGYI